MKVVLSTRSKYPALTKKVQSLFDRCEYITDRQALTHRTDWGYLSDCFFNTDADFVISVDEDFFLFEPVLIDKTIEHMIEHDLDIIGSKCCTITGGGGIIDSWFHISNIKNIQKYKPTKVDMVKLHALKITDLYNVKTSEYYSEFDKHEIFFMQMKEKGCNFQGLDCRERMQMEVICARDFDIGIHTRQGRDYNIKEIKEHIDEVYNFVRSKYHEKHFSHS